MFASEFAYDRPASLDDALALLAKHGDQAKVLAGGHSLLPAMKLRLAEPSRLIDLGRIAELKSIEVVADAVRIGAMATHYDIESSKALKDACPLLPAVASHIGDVQVRNAGTIGGSLVHADPAADWPAAILALDAEVEIAGPTGRRTLKAADLFVGIMETAVGPNEILCQIRVRRTPKTVAYVKSAQKASGFALAGVAAVVDRAGKRVAVAVTGVAPSAYRATGVEQALAGKALDKKGIEAAVAHAAQGVQPLHDIHASAEYRAHLAQINARRALMRAAGLG